jgi:hypothetical protein
MLGYNNGSTAQDTVHAGICRPSNDNTVTCGTSSFRWSTVYSAGGVVTTSDANQKTNIAPLDPSMGLAFVNKLQPKTWTWCSGNTTDVQYGLVYQEVDALDTNNNFGFLYPAEAGTDINGNTVEGINGLNYNGLMAPILLAIQQLSATVQSQATTISQLQSTVASLQSQILVLQSKISISTS